MTWSKIRSPAKPAEARAVRNEQAYLESRDFKRAGQLAAKSEWVEEELISFMKLTASSALPLAETTETSTPSRQVL